MMWIYLFGVCAHVDNIQSTRVHNAYISVYLQICQIFSGYDAIIKRHLSCDQQDALNAEMKLTTGICPSRLNRLFPA